jgi:hypothetical protein
MVIKADASAGRIGDLNKSAGRVISVLGIKPMGLAYLQQAAGGVKAHYTGIDAGVAKALFGFFQAAFGGAGRIVAKDL